MMEDSMTKFQFGTLNFNCEAEYYFTLGSFAS